VGDIDVLNPLQTLVLVYGPVRLCDPWDAKSACLFGPGHEGTSVGTVLLAVRYGKCGMHELDDLSHRRASLSLSLCGSITPLEASYKRVVRQMAHWLEELDRHDAASWEGWIDREVGLT
jgi:hypothetical protein